MVVNLSRVMCRHVRRSTDRLRHFHIAGHVIIQTPKPWHTYTHIPFLAIPPTHPPTHQPQQPQHQPPLTPPRKLRRRCPTLINPPTLTINYPPPPSPNQALAPRSSTGATTSRPWPRATASTPLTSSALVRPLVVVGVGFSPRLRCGPWVVGVGCFFSVLRRTGSLGPLLASLHLGEGGDGGGLGIGAGRCVGRSVGGVGGWVGNGRSG